MERRRRTLLRGRSLEAKCLLALGLAIAMSIFFATLLIQWIAERLVAETIRIAAQNYASSVLVDEHLDAILDDGRESDLPPQQDDRPDGGDLPEMLHTLSRPVGFEGIRHQLLRLADSREHENLSGETATAAIDLHALESLRQSMASELPPGDPADESASQGGESRTNSFPQQIAIRLTGPRLSDILFEEAGPIDGLYFYYHPVRFDARCVDCHAASSPNDPTSTQSAAANASPFRVLRIAIPYEATRVWTIWTYSLMYAVAVATLAIALFLAHRILRRLVIRPLKYLRDVSDRVAGGEVDVRSQIDTRDEFQSLSDSFNSMLRHLVATQDDLRQVNQKLDDKVDDLARINFELFEANRMKSEFLANMSHELRTPLNSILGFSEVLQSIESLNDKQRRYAANILKSGRVLLDMINDILDLAKIEAGKMQLRCGDFDVAATVRTQCDLVRSLSDEKNIDVRVAILPSDAAAATVHQDKGKLQQVLNNLLSNAIKFTPEGGLITVSVDVRSNERFEIAVADTGLGIAEHERDAIFEKFRQLRSNKNPDALTREISGTGLGLSITRELCRLMGGEIRVDSEVGKGSTFTIELPRYCAAPREMLAAAETT